AITNLPRFVRAQTEQPYVLIPYQQDEWVKAQAQAYQQRTVDEIVQLYSSMNRAIITVISVMPASAYDHSCTTADGTTVSLQWLVQDYVEHMEHHLDQLQKQIS
ncbi:DUF664 domain-containing protein, partial [Mesorhizobium sp. M00.F.Ca.ET.186.01.1.1]